LPQSEIMKNQKLKNPRLSVFAFSLLVFMMTIIVACNSKKSANVSDKNLDVSNVELIITYPPFPQQESGYTYLVHAMMKKTGLYSFQQATVNNLKCDIFFKSENNILTEAKSTKILKKGEHIVLWSYFSSTNLHKQQDTLGNIIYDPVNIHYNAGKNQKSMNLTIHQPDTVKVYLAE
jgi:hypothetical protein